jgi:hypothetical protein
MVDAKMTAGAGRGLNNLAVKEVLLRSWREDRDGDGDGDKESVPEVRKGPSFAVNDGKAVKVDWTVQRGNNNAAGWRRGAPQARFGRGIDPSQHLRHSPTLFQPATPLLSLLTANSLTPMLTVRSPLPRNIPENIHKSPALVLHRASLTCVNSTNLPPAPLPSVRRRS